MSRGLAAVQAREKNAKKQAKTVQPVDGKAARESQLKLVCSVCKIQLSDKVVYKAHFEAKHPKLPTPPEIA